jgi:hypothetical protein
MQNVMTWHLYKTTKISIEAIVLLHLFTVVKCDLCFEQANHMKLKLTLCRSYLKPYCMGRKTVFFFTRQLIYILSKRALEHLGRQGAFKSRALWSIRAGKGLKNPGIYMDLSMI